MKGAAARPSADSAEPWQACSRGTPHVCAPGVRCWRTSTKALLLTLLAALAAAPLAVVWGISHAQVDDYLGPHRATFSSNFRGEVELNLGPIGNAYLESPARPIGLTITVGGVGPAGEHLSSFFSEQTLVAYTSLYTEPQEALSGIVERLAHDAVQEGLKAEAVLLLGIAIWRLRAQLVPP